MDSLLEKKLQAKETVLIEGPKWCGKTTTTEKIAASKILMARADVKNNFKSLLELPEEAALEQAFDYYDAVTKEDITQFDGVKRTSERIQRLMRAYARHQGTQHQSQHNILKTAILPHLMMIL